jgi:hypothetical protein
MTFINCREIESLDISSQSKKENAKQALLTELRAIIENIILQVKNNMFDFTPYSFERNSDSGLTDKGGFYLIINKTKKKVYLGSTGNLVQRKGEYNRDFNDITRRYNPGIKADVKATGTNDFHFVPILSFSLTNCVLPSDLGGKSKKAFISEFFDTQVESTLLQGYLADDSTLKDMFYNTAIFGRFTPGNTRGGTPQSGTRSRPVSFNGEYAWESVLAASISLGVDRATVRSRINSDSFSLSELSQNDYNNFPDNLKISGLNATSYFSDKPEVLQRIKRELRFRLR